MGRINKVGHFDHLPLVIVGFLLVFGLVMIYEASSVSALQNFNDKYFFLKEQIKWIFLGLGAFFGCYFFDYRKILSFSLPVLILSLGLLIGVFLPGFGVKVYGAHRWVNFGFAVFQASELAKLAIIIYLSAWLTNREKGRLVPFILLVGLVVGLIVLEPDMGTAIVILGVALSIYWLSDNPILGLFSLIPVVVIGAIGLALQSKYRLARVLTLFNPDIDPLGASYHIRQALIALGSGGFFGLGLGNSRQKYSYLPEATTDSIFAIVGEELGFMGAGLLILCYLVFFLKGIRQTLKVNEPFGRLLGLGILFWILIQTAVNIGSMVALIPLTGVPLPFISYGGSAIVIELAALGILGSIWRINL